MLKPFTDVKEYATFTHERDLALEKILHVHLNAIDNIVAKLHQKVLTAGHDKRYVVAFVKNSTGPIRHEFDLAAIQTARIAERLRAESYFLSHISECEAIGRVLQRPQRYDCHTKSMHAKPTHDGSNLQDRMQLGFDRLRRDVEDAFSLSLVLQSDKAETDWRVSKAFPATKPKPKRTRALKKQIKEADPFSNRRIGTKVNVKGQDPFSMNYGFADDDLWDDILADYNATELPSNIFARGPEDKTLFYDVTSDADESRYSWEVEQEVTEDFVRSVRSGSNDAANENGITDLMWVAVLDKVTDECCRVRDGQSSSAIEEMLDNGKLDDDDSDAIVAPAHFNCRCKSVPMGDDLPDTKVDFNSFGDWLDSKGNAS